MLRRGIGLTIAVACAVAAVALPGVALPRPIAALIAARPAPTASPAPASPAGVSLQERLTALLDGTVGPGRAAVTVDAIVDHNRVSRQSLRYARRGVAVQSRSRARARAATARAPARRRGRTARR